MGAGIAGGRGGWASHSLLLTKISVPLFAEHTALERPGLDRGSQPSSRLQG